MLRLIPILYLIYAILPSVTIAESRTRLGVSVPLSGDSALYGADIRDAVRFANETIAANRYELVFEDDRCNEKSAVSVAQKFVSQDKVFAVIGFGCSGAVLAAAPVYERNKTIVIASATGAPAISQAGDYIFRTIPSLNVAAKKLFQHAAENFKSVGILSEDTAYCQGLQSAFVKENGLGKLTIYTESYLPDTTDFRSTLLRLKLKNPDVLFLNPQTEVGLVRLVKQLRELHWNPRLYAAYYPGSPTFLKEFGRSEDGIIYADLPFPKQYLTEHGLEVYDQYRTKFGEPKSGDYNIILSILAFEAIDQALQNSTDLKAYLYGHRFKNLVDDYGFDMNGDVDSSKITFVLKTIKDGHVMPFDGSKKGR